MDAGNDRWAEPLVGYLASVSLRGSCRAAAGPGRLMARAGRAFTGDGTRDGCGT
jgi:hypothetical protein